MAPEAGPAVADVDLGDIEVDQHPPVEAGDLDFRHGPARRMGRQAAKQRVEPCRERRGVDGADHGDPERVARQKGLVQRHEIVADDRVDFAEFAARGARVGVVGPGRAAPRLRGHEVRVLRLALERGVDLAAHALQRFGVETRGVEGERGEFEGLVEIARQRLHVAGELVAVGGEMQADRVIVERALEGLRIEIARALVEHAREDRGGAGLALRILRGAACKGELHGDQRHGVIFHQPGLDPGWRHDVLDARGARDFCGCVRLFWQALEDGLLRL